MQAGTTNAESNKQDRAGTCAKLKHNVNPTCPVAPPPLAHGKNMNGHNSATNPLPSPPHGNTSKIIADNVDNHAELVRPDPRHMLCKECLQTHICPGCIVAAETTDFTAISDTA